MSIYKHKIQLALLIIAGLFLSPFAEAAFRTAKTGRVNLMVHLFQQSQVHV